MIRAIGFVDTAADGTFPTGVARVNRVHRDACPSRLVSDKTFELEERPVGVPCALLASYRDPRPNPCEFFQGNRPLRVMRLLHDALTDCVVGVFLETSLSSTDLAQLATRGLRAFALQVAATMGVDAALLLNCRAAERLPIGVSREIDDAKIDAKRVRNVNRVGISYFAGGCEKEAIAEQDQVAFALPGLQQFALALPADKGNMQATVNCPDRDRRLANVPAQDTVIVYDSTVRLERALSFAVELVSVSHLRQQAHNYLRRQAETFLDLVVQQLVQVKRLEGLRLPGSRADIVTRFVGEFQRAVQRVSLSSIGQEFDLCNQLHGCILACVC